MAGGHGSPIINSNLSDSTMRSALDTKSLSSNRNVEDVVLQNTLAGSNRSEQVAHKLVQDASLSQESMTSKPYRNEV